VGGVTTTTIEERGSARLVGTVRGPTGPVPGATVRVERLVADQMRRTDVVTGPDGRFELADVPGGRYRVRAFLAPSLAQTTAEVRFLADGQAHEIDLVVEDQRGLVVRADAAPDTPTEGSPVNVVALVTSRTVDADGVVRAQPVAGQVVELLGLGRWALRDDGGAAGSSSSAVTSSSATARTDASGRVRFELTCVTAGAPGLSLQVPITVRTGPTGAGSTPPTSSTTSEVVPLELPACAPSASPSSTTSTTAGTASTATTVP
jgi:hypothetical protein